MTVNSGDFPTFYLCPGGGQEHGEDAHEALRRECREEVGCDVVVGGLAFFGDYIGANNEYAGHDGWAHQREAYFFCELAPARSPRLTDAGDRWQTGIAWLPLDGLVGRAPVAEGAGRVAGRARSRPSALPRERELTLPNSHAPELEMLWEPNDPSRVLDERFGFGDPESAGRWVAAKLDEHWGVGSTQCERIVMSDGNALAWVGTPTGRLIAKWSVAPERFPRLAAIARLTRWLDDQGLPVSAAVPSLGGHLQVRGRRCLDGRTTRDPGELLDIAAPDQVHASGAVLARLHEALSAYPDAAQLVSPDGPSGPLAARITDWLDSASDHVPSDACDALRELVAAAPPETLPTQLVHGDFRSANVLCAGGRVVAVIDFEEARLDHRVVELARSAVMLGTRFRNWGPVSSDVRAGFLAGYESVRKLTPVEMHWWDILVVWHGLALVSPAGDPTGWGQSALDHLARISPEFACP